MYERRVGRFGIPQNDSCLPMHLENIKLLNGDCLELMKELEDDSVNMILADLPYGISACRWDTVIPMDKLWEHYIRLIKKDGAIVLFGCEPFSSMVRTSNMDMYKYDWKWEKPTGANFLNYKYQPAKVHEDIMIFGKSACARSKNGTMKYYPQMTKGEPYDKGFGRMREKGENATVSSNLKKVRTVNKGTRYPRNIQRFKYDKDKYHPTQKPVALLEYLIKTYTDEGDLVLDNVMGCGGTGIACKNLNRRFIGMELDEKYFNIAKERIEN